MAFQLKLVKRDDFLADVDSLDLSGYNAGFDLAEGGYVPEEPEEGDAWLSEALTLRASGTSMDDLAANVQGLREKVRQVKEYEEGAQETGVWLRAQVTGEGLARQALVRTAKVQAASSIYSSAARFKFFLRNYGLAFERAAWWEDTAYLSVGPAEINCVGGTYSYGTVVGDAPARLAQVKFMGVNGGGGPLERFWVGFRTNRFGNRANFQPYWSLRKGIAFGADTTGGTSNPDATTKDGYKTVTTFATQAGLARRVSITVGNVTSNYSDQRGYYNILLRARLSSSGVVRLRLVDGPYSPVYSEIKDARVQSREVVSSTDWQFYELGPVQIPSPGRIYGTSVQYYGMGIDAERISGTPNLEMDCLVPIPAAEGFIYAENGAVQYVTGDVRPLYVQQRPENTVESVWMQSGISQRVGKPQVKGGLPVGAGTLVLAGQRESNSVLADSVDFSIYAFERWALLRGSET